MYPKKSVEKSFCFSWGKQRPMSNSSRMVTNKEWERWQADGCKTSVAFYDRVLARTRRSSDRSRWSSALKRPRTLGWCSRITKQRQCAALWARPPSVTYCFRNGLGSANTTEFQITGILADRISNLLERRESQARDEEGQWSTYEFSWFGITLSQNDLLLSFLFRLFDREHCSLSFLLGHLGKMTRRWVIQRIASRRLTCFASTAAVYCVPKLSSVMETSSKRISKSFARSIRSSRIRFETCCRWVINCEALNLATTPFKTSLQIDGKTRSSQSKPKDWYSFGKRVWSGRARTRSAKEREGRVLR